jgi:hypothetical protein
MRATDADLIQLSDDDLLRWVIDQGLRPNVLVTSHGFSVVRIAEYFTERLPGMRLLYDVSLMSAGEQVALAKWIDTVGPGTQIVSISSEPLWPLVGQGRFLERLYYRLNTIACEAMPAGGVLTYRGGRVES